MEHDVSSTETAVDALLVYWLNGTHDEAMAAWWQTDEAHETAREVVEVVLSAGSSSAAEREYDAAIKTTQRLIDGWSLSVTTGRWVRSHLGQETTELVSKDEAKWIGKALKPMGEDK